MSGCTDFVTEEKYNQLLTIVQNLQIQVEQTITLLDDHIRQPVPQAHNYEPEFVVDTQLNGAEIKTSVTIEGVERNSTITLPDSVIPFVTMDIFETTPGEYVFKVGVNGEFDEDTLAIELEQLDFAITDLGENQYDFEITLGEQLKAQTLSLTVPEPEVLELQELDFSVDISNLFDRYTFAVTIDGVTKRDSITIDSNNLTVNRGSFGNNNNEDNDVGCEGLGEAMQLNLNEILAAIAAVQAQVTQVKEVVTVEVEAEALTAFDCPKTDPDSGEESEAAKTEDYKLATLPAIHEMLRHLNENQVSMFEKICEGGGALALPAWWQTRLNADVPQIACVFRKGGSSTYHTISIPHPADTSKPTKAILPAYTKGNYQGMVVCRDNSKFIINCVTEAEAERMCDAAIDLIHNDWLELPPRIYTGKRKGQAVSVDPMLPTSIEYFKSGQQNTIPNWRVRVTGLE